MHTDNSIILSLEDVSKSYKTENNRLQILKDVTFCAQLGKSYSIVGPSGSGKTTLLAICAGLERADSGTVNLCGMHFGEKTEDELSKLRREKLGFVFQTFQLIPTLTALENVMVPGELQGIKGIREEACKLLERVGLAERSTHYPAQLSGGEQQRVAIARAFSNKPQVLFADEPTGNLDRETGQRIVNLLFSLQNETNTTMIIVTHDETLAGRTSKRLSLKQGNLVDKND